MAFTLPPLPYPLDALEPVIDRKTMEIHHGKHHQTYVTNLNEALDGHRDLEALSVNQLLAEDLAVVPGGLKAAVRNNGGGHANHSFFWQILSPQGDLGTGLSLRSAIDRTFGSLTDMKTRFNAAATARFGSGWAWLVTEPGNSLSIISTPNQDSPVMSGYIPILALDVWEHAYYLSYQNRRAEYVEAWWKLVNWRKAEELYRSTLSS